MAEVIIVEAPSQAPSHFLPMESRPVVFNDENWDDDVPDIAPIAVQRAPASESRSLPIPEPRKRHMCKGSASRYNPQRHRERASAIEKIVVRGRANANRWLEHDGRGHNYREE